MAGAASYRVKAQMVVAKVTDQRHEVYLGRGAFLPTEVDKPEIKRLLALGLIEAVQATRSGTRSQPAETEAAAQAEAAAKAAAETEAAQAEAAAKAAAETEAAQAEAAQAAETEAKAAAGGKAK